MHTTVDMQRGGIHNGVHDMQSLRVCTCIAVLKRGWRPSCACNCRCISCSAQGLHTFDRKASTHHCSRVLRSSTRAPGRRWTARASPTCLSWRTRPSTPARTTGPSVMRWRPRRRPPVARASSRATRRPTSRYTAMLTVESSGRLAAPVLPCNKHTVQERACSDGQGASWADIARGLPLQKHRCA